MLSLLGKQALKPSACLAADFKQLTDFLISVIKPFLLEWLYVAWKHMSDDAEVVKRVWKKCGLHVPLDDSKEDVLQKAQLAMSDPDHYPLPSLPQRRSHKPATRSTARSGQTRGGPGR
jgi:hypothetical protein